MAGGPKQTKSLLRRRCHCPDCLSYVGESCWSGPIRELADCAAKVTDRCAAHRQWRDKRRTFWPRASPPPAARTPLRPAATPRRGSLLLLFGLDLSAAGAGLALAFWWVPSPQHLLLRAVSEDAWARLEASRWPASSWAGYGLGERGVADVWPPSAARIAGGPRARDAALLAWLS